MMRLTFSAYTKITWSCALISIALSVIDELDLVPEFNPQTMVYYGYLIFRDISMLLVVVYAALVACRFTRELADRYSDMTLFGRHFHESIMGIMFISGGIFMTLHGNYLDRVLGSIMLVTGGFVIGRDWKDVLAGKFIELREKKRGGDNGAMG